MADIYNDKSINFSSKEDGKLIDHYYSASALLGFSVASCMDPSLNLIKAPLSSRGSKTLAKEKPTTMENFSFLLGYIYTYG